MTRVAGVDLSLASTGVALLDTLATPGADLRRIRTTGHRADTLAQRGERLDGIRHDVMELLDALGPQLVAIEAPAFGQPGGSTHDRAGLWWLVVHDCYLAGFDVVEIPPTSRAKYATGVGSGPRASKDAVLAATIHRYPGIHVDGNDVADALLLGAIALRHLGDPIDDVPETHLLALAKVRWPEPYPIEEDS